MVRIDVHGAKLIAKVDDKLAETNILGLDASNSYGVATDLTSVVLIGGLSPEEKLHGVKYIIESFVGCIKDMVLKAGKAAFDLLPIKPLIATKHDNVQEGCINKCRTRENLCFVGSMCINHYNELSCDCFGTCYEGELCDVYTATILTLRGSSYMSYRVYDWKDRVHSSVNRIGIHFKTWFNDSALFYASGESPRHHHIAVSIVNGSVLVHVDMGDESAATVSQLGTAVSNNSWHNLTILHSHDQLLVSLDDDVRLLDLGEGQLQHLYIDPEIYIGGGPELHKRKGLQSHNNFVGSLKYVYFNDVSILYELKKNNPKVHYIGVLDPLYAEEDVDDIPITFPFPVAHVWWTNDNPDALSLAFDFKSSRAMAVLAYSEVTTATGQGYWEVRLVNEEIRFELVPDVTKNVTHLTTLKYENKGAWHTVELNYTRGELGLAVDFKHKEADLYGLKFKMSKKVIIGSGIGAKASLGLIGCMREIIINGVQMEPRYLVRTHHTVGQVSLDNCQLVDPCKRPNACEHGGKCQVKDDRLTCDCKGTGYIGKNCHFAKFRKTCEELALLGYSKPDVYLIDIDGNGRFPPAHVKCEFQSLENSTKTIVEHNLPSQVDVRSLAENDFSFTITYREFTSEMLQELISHSLYCSQYIKYDCYKAPLELHSATWFISAAHNGTVDYLGNVKEGVLSLCWSVVHLIIHL
ncbi:contactin-associated protein-like 5 [Nilaparvata lugens]|uniref:contactin-associated protein-like 5 n=1 Tax=Nilaparvata lugens TaxID=108931 RepID=UPI00193E2B66|nr:contactin-associated protein-like 5 [Nilaparvata lugens]